MGSHRLGLVAEVALGIVEPSLARAEDDAHDERGRAAAHVHRSGSREVDDSLSEVRLGREGREEAVVTPVRVGAHGVHPPDEEEREEEVGGHLGALGDGTGGDAGHGAGERELEEPVTCAKREGWMGRGGGRSQ